MQKIFYRIFLIAWISVGVALVIYGIVTSTTEWLLLIIYNVLTAIVVLWNLHLGKKTQKEVKPNNIPTSDAGNLNVKPELLKELALIFIISAITLLFINYLARDVRSYLSNIISIGAIVLLALSLICLGYYKKYQHIPP